MNRSFSLLCIAAIGIALSGCAHTHKVQGNEMKSEIPEGVRVGIGGQEVKEGDKVNVLRAVCETRSGVGKNGTSKRTCHDEKIGEAQVLKVLDHDSAIVRPDGGFAMDTSMKVEKQ